MSRMYVGIEIGGAKLELGVGFVDGSELLALERREVVIANGAMERRESFAMEVSESTPKAQPR